MTPTKKIISLFLFLQIFSACSRINQESKAYYDSKKMRHGIVPLSGKVVKKLELASVARGKVLYEKNCLSCHGVNGEGDGALAPKGTRPVNLRELAHEVRNFKFFISISQWQGDMPGWKEPINEIEREDLTSYIKSLRQN